jgi:type IV pilus assembly protein PilE
MKFRRVHGFTLLEVMVVAAIVGILAAIALPAYQNQVRKGNRSAAQQFMMDVATKQQQILMDSRQYVAVSSGNFGNKPSDASPGVGVPEPPSTSGKYTFAVTVNNGATPPTFLITATAASGQAVDANSAKLTVDQAGNRQYLTSGGTVTGTW